MLSDDLCMKALKGSYSKRAQKAINAGCDIVLHCDPKLSDIKKLAGKGSKKMLTTSMHEIAELSGKVKKTNYKIEEMTRDFLDYYTRFS